MKLSCRIGDVAPLIPNLGTRRRFLLRFLLFHIAYCIGWPMLLAASCAVFWNVTVHTDRVSCRASHSSFPSVTASLTFLLSFSNPHYQDYYTAVNQLLKYGIFPLSYPLRPPLPGHRFLVLVRTLSRVFSGRQTKHIGGGRWHWHCCKR
jgi:hypothetical protein